MKVLVWLSGPECCLPQFMIVVSSGVLPTFLFDCSWRLFFVLYIVLDCNLLFV